MFDARCQGTEGLRYPSPEFLSCPHPDFRSPSMEGERPVFHEGNPRLAVQNLR